MTSPSWDPWLYLSIVLLSKYPTKISQDRGQDLGPSIQLFRFAHIAFLMGRACTLFKGRSRSWDVPSLFQDESLVISSLKAPFSTSKGRIRLQNFRLCGYTVKVIVFSQENWNITSSFGIWDSFNRLIGSLLFIENGHFSQFWGNSSSGRALHQRSINQFRHSTNSNERALGGTFSVAACRSVCRPFRSWVNFLSKVKVKKGTLFKGLHSEQRGCAGGKTQTFYSRPGTVLFSMGLVRAVEATRAKEFGVVSRERRSLQASHLTPDQPLQMAYKSLNP